jgi:sensor histidine kinase YesM
VKKTIFLSLYWKCQIIGWVLASLYWSYTGFASTGSNYLQLIFDFIGDVVICILITHTYRNFALKKNWHSLNLKALVPRMTPAIFILGIFFMVLITIKLYIVRLFCVQNFSISFWAFFESARLTLFVTGIRLMSIWVLAYHLYHYAQREINTVKENARLSIIAKEAQLSNLSAQLNPHFFFNSLNNIKFLIAENPESARRSIDLLSDLLRNSLYGKEDKLILVEEEINLVKDYLELEKLRFEERLQVNVVAEERLTKILIPPLSIQALVENAIKHGIDKRKDGGLIEVKVNRKEDCLQISVQNSGKLNTATQYSGLGLKNLKERLRLQFNGRATFDIVELQPETVLATISIPMA